MKASDTSQTGVMEYLLDSNEAILAVCASLTKGVRLDDEERKLLRGIKAADDFTVDHIVQLVCDGHDPLGDAYMRTNAAEERRATGTVYTPSAIIASMIEWAKTQVEPSRIVDCGCGSGRFSLAAAQAFPDALVIAVDNSPMATLMCKANSQAAGIPITVLRQDFMQAQLPFEGKGTTLWIGNPPYVRHHGLSAKQKAWFSRTLETLGIRGNCLAGLHAYFMASIAERFAPTDVGCIVMSSEWMDNGYGVTIRDILTKKIRMTRLWTYDKTEEQFAGTMSSAAVVGFAQGNPEGVVQVNEERVPLSAFEKSTRWSQVISGMDDARKDTGLVRLGEFANVHRGVVTGKNKFWVRRPGEVSEQLCTPVVAHARELTGDDPACRNVSRLSRLVTLPADLSTLPDDLHAEAQGIIDEGLRNDVDEGFVARHRKNWWSIKAPEPPAIMMTYMARHPPVFVINSDKLGMLNVVHGIYPSIELSEHALANLVDYLNNHVRMDDGRTYSGGLVKFEPREVERLLVPSPEVLEG